MQQLQGFKGRDLDFRILVTFLPKYYLSDLEKIIKALKLRNLKMINLAEGLPEILNNEKSEGIFLDIGGDLTQIFLISRGEFFHYLAALY